jgi:hypothetical protein
MFELLAVALATSDLNLELVCQAQWPDTEVSQSFTPKKDADGWYHPEVTRTTKQVTKTGTVHVSLHGAVGTLDLGSDGKRELTNVVADERSISAEYVIKGALYGRSVRQVQINRMTGEIRLLNKESSVLDGTCSAESTQPKF